MMRTWFGSSAMAGVVAFAFIGCNSILDNQPGVASDTSQATTVPPPDASPTPGEEPSEPDASTSLPDAGETPSPNCPAGQQMCGGTCVSMTDPLFGCGSPSCSPCPSLFSSMGCQGKTCVITACAPGHADCNANAADGCEADLSKATTCGACKVACAGAAPLCAPASPSFQCTNGCTPAAPLKCGDKCVTTTDPTACGPACAVCPEPPNTAATCTAAVCASACKVGFGNCDANAVNGCEATFASDPLNCGVCAKSCLGQPCVNGVCTVPPVP